jgi:hypothetical protein
MSLPATHHERQQKNQTSESGIDKPGQALLKS